MTTRITILGAGSWGRALGLLLLENGHSVQMWSHRAFEGNFPCPIHTNMSDAIIGSDVVLCVVPSHAVRDVMKAAGQFFTPKTIVLSCSKGIEVSSMRLMSEVLTEVLPDHPVNQRCFLSGPSFAEEVVQRHPTAVVIAGTDASITARVQKLLRNDYFLPYLHDDIPGIEVGGAIKNVLAIGAGIVDGLGFGYNTRAALITRGLYEMIKIGQLYGAQPLTFSGLAGVGDLVLTCTGPLSRNHQVGVALAKGKHLSEILSHMNMVAEGVKTAEAVHRLITHHKLTAPISTQVYRILYQNIPAREAVMEILKLQIGEEQGAIH
ncbi:MAG: glycerol-3-phosphate dehydrogenase [Deltaproteobacteria bacterium CG11_big_fil_rev_8_21_14_0_20_47_16]|nr:MAG: glycerol-3-phosphate dehydrogenase [Deltaproteobacteria bacterium CG11_big_fil_rev_8_21_14_0_20_47_16]